MLLELILSFNSLVLSQAYTSAALIISMLKSLFILNNKSYKARIFVFSLTNLLLFICDYSVLKTTN